MLLLIVAPPRFAARYLQVVGAFARFLSTTEQVDRVLAQQTALDLVSMPEWREYALPAQLTVQEVMSERPHVTRADAPLREATRDMVRSRVAALPVVDNEDRLVGMLSEREVIRDLVATYLQRAMLGGSVRAIGMGGKDARRTVRDVMTRQVLCVSPDQPLAEVASLMVNKDTGRVPVVREGRVVGFLTRGDIVRKLIGS